MKSTSGEKSLLKGVINEERIRYLINDLGYERVTIKESGIDLLYKAPHLPYASLPYSPKKKFILFEITSFKSRHKKLKKIDEKTKKAKEILEKYHNEPSADIGKVLIIYDYPIERTIHKKFSTNALKLNVCIWDERRIRLYEIIKANIIWSKGFFMENLTEDSIALVNFPKLSFPSFDYEIQVCFDNLSKILRFREAKKCLKKIKEIVEKLNREYAKRYGKNLKTNVKLTFFCPKECTTMHEELKREADKIK